MDDDGRRTTDDDDDYDGRGCVAPTCARFPYTEKCTESESDIKNNHLLYTINPTQQNTFETLTFV